MTARTNFDHFFTTFKSDPLWVAMVNTREDSPWHREANVGVHTQMLLDWYDHNLASNRNELQQMYTRVACVFHDVGKPPAQVVKFSEERGEYRAYHGHELLSARLWIDWAARNQEMVSEVLRFNLPQVAGVALMLEHHVPWATKNENKRKALKTAFLNRVGEFGHRAWLDLLLSDQHGRIADEQAKHLSAVDEWMQDWETL